MSKGWILKKTGWGRPVRYVTWLQVWMSLKRVPIVEFARMMMCGDTTVERWRAGRPVDAHFAKLARAFFPDIPIHLLGGPVARINQPLPQNSRTPEMYKYIIKISGLCDRPIYPAALEYARRKYLQASDEIMAGGEPDSDGV